MTQNEDRSLNADTLFNHVSLAPMRLMFLSAFVCLSLSATFHLYSAMSAKAHSFLSRLDYAGISVLIFGSVVPVYWYGFACEEVAVNKWCWLSVSLLIDGACFVTTLWPRFDQAQYRTWRGVIYVVAGLFCSAVWIDLYWYASPYKMNVPVLVYAIGGLIYILGAVTYILRVPERLKPGFFDLIGASH